jgi:hypothetical protein
MSDYGLIYRLDECIGLLKHLTLFWRCNDSIFILSSPTRNSVRYFYWVHVSNWNLTRMSCISLTHHHLLQLLLLLIQNWSVNWLSVTSWILSKYFSLTGFELILVNWPSYWLSPSKLSMSKFFIWRIGHAEHVSPLLSHHGCCFTIDSSLRRIERRIFQEIRGMNVVGLGFLVLRIKWVLDDYIIGVGRRQSWLKSWTVLSCGVSIRLTLHFYEVWSLNHQVSILSTLRPYHYLPWSLIIRYVVSH